MWPTFRRSVHLQRHVLTLLIAPTIQNHEIWNLWKEWEREDRRFTRCRGKSRSCCKSGRDFPETYAPDPHWSVSRISWSGSGFLYHNRLPHDHRFLLDFRDRSALQSRSRQPTPLLNNMSGSWSKRLRFGNPPYTCSRGKNKR